MRCIASSFDVILIQMQLSESQNTLFHWWKLIWGLWKHPKNFAALLEDCSEERSITQIHTGPLDPQNKHPQRCLTAFSVQINAICTLPFETIFEFRTVQVYRAETRIPEFCTLLSRKISLSGQIMLQGPAEAPNNKNPCWALNETALLQICVVTMH